MFSQITFMVLGKKCGWKDRLFDKIASHQLFYRYYLIRCITTNKFCCCQSYPHLLLVCIRLFISMNENTYETAYSGFQWVVGWWHTIIIRMLMKQTLHQLCIYPVNRLSCFILFELLIALLSKWASLLTWLIFKWKLTDDVDWFNLDFQTREH